MRPNPSRPPAATLRDGAATCLNASALRGQIGLVVVAEVLVISGHQWSSVVISGDQRSSQVITGHQRSSVVIRGHQRSSEVIRRALGEVIRGHQWSSEVIRGHQWSSEVIRGHRRPSEVISAAHLRDDLSAHAPPEDGARVARTRRPAVGAVQVQYRRGSAARHRRPS